MPDVVRLAAAVCAPTMAIVAWLMDSPDDRLDRGRLDELNRLQRQIQGPPGS